MHSEAHALLYGTNPLNRQKLDSKKLLGISRSSLSLPPRLFPALALPFRPWAPRRGSPVAPTWLGAGSRDWKALLSFQARLPGEGLESSRSLGSRVVSWSVAGVVGRERAENHCFTASERAQLRRQKPARPGTLSQRPALA